MAKVSDFTKKLTALPGVGGYLLSQQGGNILAHNLQDPSHYRQWMEELLQQGAKANGTLGEHQEFRGVSLAVSNERMLLLFPVKQYSLLVVQDVQVGNEQLFQEISALIQDTVDNNN
ncbi:hypothetical protein [uncultured Desulfuromonas sp.]|uniref:hypothetical protein n=1 Tax=uncultured Desulfuromonas sp. TaxID=181013 RepID=UPI002AAAD159|nr:hypothetical protein [uncultured Desulfuromonas sp.]